MHQRSVFDQIFEALSDDVDFEYVIVDGTIVRVHQHGIGAKEAMGRATRSESLFDYIISIIYYIIFC